MSRIRLALLSGAGLLLLASVAPPPLDRAKTAVAAEPVTQVIPAIAPAYQPEPPPPPEPEPPPTAEEAFQDGVLIVVSLPAQRMFVFKRGEVWDTSKVSTGRRGNETPVGTFPILQKKVHHRSTLYDDAPMPYMQRLTWDGVALHAGRVPGYPASHGCIRLPKSFAKKLYGITGFSSTVVVVTDEPVSSPKEAEAMV